MSGDPLKLFKGYLFSRVLDARVIAMVAIVCGMSSLGAVTLMPPDGWPNEEWSPRLYGSPTIDTVELQGENWVRIARTSLTGAGNGSGQIVYNAGHYNVNNIPVLHEDNQLGDIAGSVIIGGSSFGDMRGVYLRANVSNFYSTGGKAQPLGYYIALTSSSLALYWQPGDAFAGSLTPLISDTYTTTLQPLTETTNNQYKLEFSAIGMQFDATLWSLDENGNTTGDPLASISYLDTRPEARSEGYFALRGGRYGGEISAYFRNLELSMIPEPSTALLVLSAGLLAFKRRKN